MTKLGNLLFIVLAFALMANPASALTAQQIADSVIDEMNNVSDYTATYDVDFDDARDDQTGGTIKWKRTTSGEWKRLLIEGSPGDLTLKTDGSGAWNVVDADDPPAVAYNYVAASENFWSTWLKVYFNMPMWWMENVLDDNAWTPTSPTTETVNSVSCYKIESGVYTVWIDVATVKKVIRAKRNAPQNGSWRLDFSNYSNVESTAMLPSSMVLTGYTNGVANASMTYTLSNVNINESIADSVFQINSPN